MKKIFFIILSALMISSCQLIDDEDDGKKKAWPDGRIPYIAIGFNNEEKQIILEATKEWFICTGGLIKFVPVFNTNEENILFIIKVSSSNDGVGGFSQIGCKKKSYLFLSNETFNAEHDTSVYYVSHEFGHVIGLPHEHQRPDSSLYVTIDFHNPLGISTKPSLLILYQFSPFNYNNQLYDYSKFPYDIKSIMHYRNISDQYYIKSKNNPSEEVGGTKISIIDVLKVYSIYGRKNK